MGRFGFCGPTYASQSRNEDCERCVNLVPEIVESPGGKSAMAMYYSPGLLARYQISNAAVSGLFACRPNGSTVDRLFAVVQTGVDQALYELFADFSKINRGPLTAGASAPVSFAHNGVQLAICTSGHIWIFNMTTNAAPTLPGAAPTTAAQIAYCDGFFVALLQNSNNVACSALLDGTMWPGLNVAQISEFPDNVISMIVNQRIIYFLGAKATVPYSNVGALNFPFLPIQGAFGENGCGATYATVRLDNSIFWIDNDERGGVIARRLSGSTPQRVSNYSVENIWQSYPKVSDAIGYSFQDQGHSFWHIYFPSGISVDGVAGAGASWRYDVSSGMWHEVAFWDTVKGQYEAHHSQNYAYAFGRHFVGDWSSGTIYEMNIGFYTDAGALIRRMRRAPTISKENQWIFHHEVEIDLESGLGPQPPLTGPSGSPQNYILQDVNGNLWQLAITDAGGLNLAEIAAGSASTIVLNDAVVPGESWQLGVNALGQLTATGVQYGTQYKTLLPISSPSSLQSALMISAGQIQVGVPCAANRDPQLQLRWSNDCGHTWTSFYSLDCGQAGQYQKRVIKRRLGRARNRTYEVVMFDPIPWRFVDAYLKATPGYDSKERLSKELGKSA